MYGKRIETKKKYNFSSRDYPGPSFIMQALLWKGIVHLAERFEKSLLF